MNAELIATSLEMVAETVGDPAPLVYARLFEARPDMKPLFVRDVDGGVKGHMLAQAIDALLDFAGERRYGDAMMRCEIVNHEHLGVPREVFASFFTAMRDTFKDALGPAWTREIDAAWREMLSQVDATLAEP